MLFIVTANVLDAIPPALRDRLEVIRLSGYTQEEKLSIAKRYLIPRQIEENGLKPEQVRISDNALRHLISGYTAEAGLRHLEREIGSICRKIARKVAAGKTAAATVNPATVTRLLGAPRYLPEEERDQAEIGLVNGLAWTEVGGEIP